MFESRNLRVRSVYGVLMLALAGLSVRPARGQSRSSVSPAAASPSAATAPRAKFDLEGSPPAAKQVARSSPPNPRAELLFRDGREAFSRGDYAVACAKFAESDLLEPSPGAKLNRGLCEEQLGHWALAWRLIQDSAATLSADDERAPIAWQHAQALRGKLAFLTITIAPRAPSSARVISDGAALRRSELGIPLPYDPGRHVLQVSAGGFHTRTTQVSLEPGTSRVIELSVGTALPQRAVTWHEPAASSDPWRTSSLVLGGAAAALLVVGATSGAVALSAKHEMDASCDARAACSERGMRAAARGESYATASTASFIGALTLGGLGAALWIVTGGSREAKQSAFDTRGLRLEFQ